MNQARLFVELDIDSAACSDGRIVPNKQTSPKSLQPRRRTTASLCRRGGKILQPWATLLDAEIDQYGRKATRASHDLSPPFVPFLVVGQGYILHIEDWEESEEI